MFRSPEKCAISIYGWLSLDSPSTLVHENSNFNYHIGIFYVSCYNIYIHYGWEGIKYKLKRLKEKILNNTSLTGLVFFGQL